MQHFQQRPGAQLQPTAPWRGSNIARCRHAFHASPRLQATPRSPSASSRCKNALGVAAVRSGRPALRQVAAAAAAAGSGGDAGPLRLEDVRRGFGGRSRGGRLQRSSSGPRVCIIGAGVNGLATAVRLLEARPDVQLTIFADQFGSDLTSAGAAGVWQPYKLSETPEVLTERWGRETYQHLMGLVHSDQAVAAGVQTCYCHCLFLSPEPDPFWAPTVHGFRRMSQAELEMFSQPVDWAGIQADAAAAAVAAAEGGGDGGQAADSVAGDGSIDCLTAAASASGFVDGYCYNTVVCEGRLYMRWLTDTLAAAGVALVQRRLGSLAELRGEGWDAVVNAAGLGARALLPDANVYPIRGQIMRVRAPWVTGCVFAHFPDAETYIIPNREWVVLGGTGQVGSASTATSLADADRIADRAIQVLPSLKQAEVLDHWVGLRPGRVRLRLEAEEAFGEAGGSAAASPSSPVLRVVHNYGHGGSGLTLAWGTAGDAVALVLQQLAAADA